MRHVAQVGAGGSEKAACGVATSTVVREASEATMNLMRQHNSGISLNLLLETGQGN